MNMLQHGAPPPGFAGNSGDAVAAVAAAVAETKGAEDDGGGFMEEERGGGRNEESERFSGGGNRWPRQETIALLKIRSEMDVEFKDSSLKGPLWEEVSRKLAELGYHRSAKKCKEKFENVYKYHKRTKDGRTTKSDGKTYRFFEQLQALETHPPPLPMRSQPPIATGNITSTTSTVSSIPVTAPNVYQTNVTSTLPTNPSPSIPAQRIGGLQSFNTSDLSDSTSSSSTSSDEQRGERRRKRKRKWKDFFERLMTEVMQKQDELEKKFLDALEKRERDRIIREEAWRVQEMSKFNKEHELLVQERSMAAAKDAAVIEFLRKISSNQESNPSNPIPLPQLQQLQNQIQPVVPPQPQPQPPPPPPPQPSRQNQHQQLVTTSPPPARPQQQSNMSGADNFQSPAPSRWPKAEIEALIELRKDLDNKYNENGPKGPLWEDISSGMRKMGYNRNAKRCKEKWENINKYYKKVKESNKKRPEDAKTCPYFHQLDALYREKAQFNPGITNPMVPIMVQPEQQWPLSQPPQPQRQENQDTEMEDRESENNDNFDDEQDEEHDDDDDNEDGAAYEIVTNKPPAASTSAAAAGNE